MAKRATTPCPALPRSSVSFRVPLWRDFSRKSKATRNLHQPDLLQWRFDSWVVKRLTSLFNSFCSNVLKQDAHFFLSRFPAALPVVIFAHFNSPYCCFCNVFNYIIKKVQSGICLSTKHSGVLKNSFNCVRAFLIKLEFGNVGFWGIPGFSRLRRGASFRRPQAEDTSSEAASTRARLIRGDSSHHYAILVSLRARDN